jgi:4-amino-4-deoxy-L-arabinose transferase-like glycosyltransferase
MDIGTDEGYYISLVKNYYDNGTFSSGVKDAAEFINQGLLYPFVLLKPLTKFDYRLPRYINIFYSLVLFYFLFIIIKKKASFFAALLFSIFLLFDRTYLFISSGVFNELSAILFLVAGIYLYTKYNSLKMEILASVFFALAMLSKMQIIPFLFASLLIIGFITKDERLKTIRVLGMASVLFGLFTFALAGVQGFSLIDTVKSIYKITGSSSEMISTLPVANRISHIANYFNIIYICLIAFLSVIIIKNFKKEDKFIQIIFIFSLLNSFWWIFLYFSIAPRNLLYSLVFLYFLASISIERLIKTSPNSYSKYFLPFLIIFLGLHIINNASFIFIEGKKGISDETLLALNGYREPFGDRNNVIQSGQFEFYDYINNNIAAGTIIYWISPDFNKDLFTERTFIYPEKNFILNKSLPKGSCFLLTYLDFKNKFVTDPLMIYLNNNASLLFKKNYWEVYQIK